MKKNVFFGGMLVMVLVFGMMSVSCASLASLFGGGAPKSFQKGSAGDTSILLRKDLDLDRAIREIVFVLSRNGFDSEMIQADVGYIRTRWNFTWNDQGKTLEGYRVRIVCNFSPDRTQLILKAEAEYLQGGNWISGFDTRAVETLRTDITQSIGN